MLSASLCSSATEARHLNRHSRHGQPARSTGTASSVSPSRNATQAPSVRVCVAALSAVTRRFSCRVCFINNTKGSSDFFRMPRLGCDEHKRRNQRAPSNASQLRPRLQRLLIYSHNGRRRCDAALTQPPGAISHCRRHRHREASHAAADTPTWSHLTRPQTHPPGAISRGRRHRRVLVE